jgi:hypothetical protein
MDYTYPSIFFSYFLFFLFLVGGIYFCIRSLKRGYWGKDAEDVKYHVFDELKVGGTPHGRSN